MAHDSHTLLKYERSPIWSTIDKHANATQSTISMNKNDNMFIIFDTGRTREKKRRNKVIKLMEREKERLRFAKRRETGKISNAG